MGEFPSPRRRKRPEPRTLLSDIVTHGEAARTILAGISFEAFLSDDLRQSAICYKVLCVSEATIQLLNVDPSIPNRYPEIPWHQIRGIGNVLRHGYRSLDIEIVWNTVVGGNLSILLDFANGELSKLS